MIVYIVVNKKLLTLKIRVMSKDEILEQEEERYQEFLEQYEGTSLCVMTERLNELEETPGADLVEIAAIRDLLKDMNCDMNPYYND